MAFGQRRPDDAGRDRILLRAADTLINTDHADVRHTSCRSILLKWPMVTTSRLRPGGLKVTVKLAGPSMDVISPGVPALMSGARYLLMSWRAITEMGTKGTAPSPVISVATSYTRSIAQPRSSVTSAMET
jgi:hypothetical protein